MVIITKRGNNVTVSPNVHKYEKVNKSTLVAKFREALDADLPFWVEFLKESDGTIKSTAICSYKGSATSNKGLVLVKDLNIAYGFTTHSNGSQSPYMNIAVRNVTSVTIDGIQYYIR